MNSVFPPRNKVTVLDNKCIAFSKAAIESILNFLQGVAGAVGDARTVLT